VSLYVGFCVVSIDFICDCCGHGCDSLLLVSFVVLRTIRLSRSKCKPLSYQLRRFPLCSTICGWFAQSVRQSIRFTTSTTSGWSVCRAVTLWSVYQTPLRLWR